MTESERDPVEELAKLVGRVDPRLPDMNRARGAMAVVERIEREARLGPATPARHGRGWPLLWASAGALAAAAVLLAWLGLRHPGLVVTAPARDHGATMTEKPAPVVPADAVTPAEELAILHVPAPKIRPLPHGRARLQGKEGGEVRASLADVGLLILRGAGQVVVEENASSGIVLRLEQGTLLVSFDHASGRSLTVRTKDTLVRVTGTVFAVRVGDGPTQVSVSRGSVEVEANGLPVSVTAGKSWQVGAKRVAALDMEIVQALRELHPSEGGRTPTSATRGPAGFVQPKQAAVPTPEVAALPAASSSANTQPQAVSASASDPVPAVDSPAAPAIAGDAETLYRAAEKALVAGHSDSAKAQLLGLIDKYPDHALVGPAMYELGRLAFAARNFYSAREQFANVRESTRADAKRFHEPAAFLICRSEQELGRKAGAIRCLERYRAEFPSSPHGGDALAALASLHLDRNDCTSALPLLEEYLDRYPNGSQLRAMQTARERCKPSP